MSIYGLKLHSFGHAAYYTSDQPLAAGDKVIVHEDERLCLGEVVSGPFTHLAHLAADALPSIVRPAGEQDLSCELRNQALTRDADSFCRSCIHERGLEMKLVGVEVFFDQSKIIFFFTAPTRIDFRELVKDLVRRYHTRIELRQIGVRHETQMNGAVGSCGMICCCKRYIRKFAPVTIRMAKEQNLFLNPSKISGSCGRLLCCLSYEQENYDNFFSKSPRIGKKYQTKHGVLRIVRTNMFRNTVSAVNEANEELEFPLEDWLALRPERLDIPSQSDMDFLPGDETYLDQDLPGEPLEGFTLSGSDPVFDEELPDFVDEDEAFGMNLSPGRKRKPMAAQASMPSSDQVKDDGRALEMHAQKRGRDSNHTHHRPKHVRLHKDSPEACAVREEQNLQQTGGKEQEKGSHPARKSRSQYPPHRKGERRPDLEHVSHEDHGQNAGFRQQKADPDTAKVGDSGRTEKGTQKSVKKKKHKKRSSPSRS